MTTSRRTFLRNSALVGGAAAFAPLDALRAWTPPPPRAQESLRVLVLGGTGFIGPHIVQYALDRGHSVSVFNRGRTNPHLFPTVEKLVGDRDGNLTALEGRTWDVVCDNSGYVPRHVRDSAQLLKGSADHYLFTSTVGVYAGWYDGNWPEGGTGEEHPTGELPEPGSEDVGKYYGQLKAICEREVEEAFPGRSVVTRPGLIVGPLDGTDRFTYYPVRLDRGGEVMAFGKPDDPVQYIDARDLAEWSVHLLEQRVTGTYNLLGPRPRFSMAEMLYGIRATTTAETSFTWVSSEFMAEQGVPEFSLPPWASQEGPMWGAAQFKRERAFEKGLRFRPFAETVADTLGWWKSLPPERRMAMRAGLRGGDLGRGPASMDAQMTREAEMLEAWKART